MKKQEPCHTVTKGCPRLCCELIDFLRGSGMMEAKEKLRDLFCKMGTLLEEPNISTAIHAVEARDSCPENLLEFCAPCGSEGDNQEFIKNLWVNV